MAIVGRDSVASDQNGVVGAHEDDLEVVMRYGERVPQAYGGTFVDGHVVVVLFIEDVARHASVLRDLVSQPDRIRVEPTSRTWHDVLAAKEEVSRELLAAPSFGVNSVGIGRRGHQFVILVGVHPYTPQRAGAIQKAVGHHPVVIEPQSPVRFVRDARS